MLVSRRASSAGNQRTAGSRMAKGDAGKSLCRAMLEVPNHGAQRFDDARDVVAANGEELEDVDLEIAVRHHVPKADRSTPIDAGVAAEQLAFRLAVDLLELLAGRNENHADGIHAVNAVLAGAEVFRTRNAREPAGNAL